LHRDRAPSDPLGPDRWLLAFAASVFVFHQAPAFAEAPLGDAIDLLTPIAVIAASTGLIASLGWPRFAAGFAFVAGLVYVHGHGVHIAANSIHNEDPVGAAEDITYFWDERFSHIEATLGWYGLVAAFCLAERDAPTRTVRTGVLVAAAGLLGWTFFTSAVEGQTWPIALLATALFVGWAVATRGDARSRPFLRTSAAAFALNALLIGVWAVWQGGVPEFSDSGFI
jgi:hypothetical protein